MEEDDPWDWHVDRVVKELCTNDRSWQPTRGTMPDPVTFEQTLRNEGITGSLLLVDADTEDVLKNDLGLKTLSMRGYLHNAIEELRQRSAKYQQWWQNHHPPNLASLYSRSIQNSHHNSPAAGFGQRLLGAGSRPDTPGTGLQNPLGFTGIAGASPHTPSRTKEAIGSPDESLLEKQHPSSGFIVSDLSGGKRRKLDFMESPQIHEHQDSPREQDSFLPQLPDASQPLVDINGKKRKRIAPTLITSVLDPYRDREIPTNADNVVMFDPQNVEPGVVFTDENGRKRLVPIQEARPDSTEPYRGQSSNEARDRGPAASTSKASEQRSGQPIETLDTGYLGKKQMVVDDLFYQGTAVGKDLPVAVAPREFSLTPEYISSGRRLYVHGAMKYFLRQERQDFSRKEEEHSAVLPYPTKLAPKFLRPSFTLYSATPDGKVNARREEVPAWPEIDPEAALFAKTHSTGNDHNPAFTTIGSGAIDRIGSYEDWDPSYLEKYKLLEGGDTVLPLYGESDEENEYDLETWAEIEAERGAQEKPRMSLKGQPISPAEIQEAVDQGIAELVTRWQETKLPKLRMKARKIWAKARRDSNKRHKIQKNQQRLTHVTARISEMRKEIALDIWTSQAQVRKQTRIMELSVFEREEKAWEITILESKVAPAKPSHQAQLQPVSKVQPAVDDGEEGESIDSATEVQSSDDGLEDFIVADELLSGTDGEQELNLADGEDEEDEDEDEDASMSDASVSTTPQKRISARQDKAHIIHEPENSNHAQSDTDDADSILAISDVRSPARHSSPSVKYEQTALPKLPRSSMNGGSHIVDLTMLSSSDGPEVIDLNTPEKKRLKIKLIPTSTSSPIAISDTDAPDLKPNPSKLPPYTDPVAIAKFTLQAWSNLQDTERLLIAFLQRELDIGARNSLFELVSSTPEQKLWSRILDRMHATAGMEEKAKGIDAKSSSSLTTLARMFLMFLCCKPQSRLSFSEKARQRHLERLEAGQDSFADLYQLLGKLQAYFGHATARRTMSHGFVDNEDENMDPQPANRRRMRNLTTSDEEALLEDDSPRKKRKKKLHEDANARDLREQDRERLAEQLERKKKLLAKLAETGGAADLARGRIIINESKLEDQGYVYVNENIGRRIKTHQIEGVRFMWNQLVTDSKNMQGCLLAHTMGLGKTMQSITLLVAIAEAARSLDPSVHSQVPPSLRVSKSLILCPPGLIDNWMDELLIWTPEGLLGDLRKISSVEVNLVSRLQTIDDWYRDGGVLIMGYQMFQTFVHNKEKKDGTRPLSEEQHEQVQKELLEGPNIIIADEAHKLKNSNAAITTAASRFRSKSRIALTGSPLSNNVEEYYAMIEWVAPNYLGPMTEFRQKYVEPIQNGLYEDSTHHERRKSLKMLKVLAEDLSPKVNRADMTVLRDQLPPKTEFVITLPLTALQRKAYSIYVKAMTSEADEVSQTTLWHWLAVLVLLVNHPSCFKSKLTERKNEAVAQQAASGTKNSTDEVIWKIGVSNKLFDKEMALFNKEFDITSIELSNKVKILCQILDISRAIGDKVLVFSQSIPTLDYLDALFMNMGRKHKRLDGTTDMSKRQTLIKDFNTGDAEVYLISTKAGGLGLNLPGANRVVIFDFSFNPVAEEQAIGRAFRIGQTKPVFVYRFVIGGTFEETVHNTAIFKMQLASRVVDKKNPVAYAKKKTGDYLFEPRDVKQEDLSDFKRIDKVLDKILQGKDQLVRAIIQSDTFEQHDEKNKLTAEEEKETLQMLNEQRLWRTNPAEYNRLIQKRFRDEAIAAQQAAAQQAVAQRITAQHAGKQLAAQSTMVGSTARPETRILPPGLKTAEGIGPSAPPHKALKLSLEPILGANTHIQQPGIVHNREQGGSDTDVASKDRTPEPAYLQPPAGPGTPRNATGTTSANEIKTVSSQHIPQRLRQDKIHSSQRQSLPPSPASPSSSRTSSTRKPSAEGSRQKTARDVPSLDGAGDNRSLESRLLEAMSRRPVKVPTTSSSPQRDRRHRRSRDEIKAEDAKAKARIEKKRAERQAERQAAGGLPSWAHKNIEKANPPPARAVKDSSPKNPTSPPQ